MPVPYSNRAIKACAVQPGQQPVNLGDAQHHGQSLPWLRPGQVRKPGQFDSEHITIEEQQRRQRLVLGRSRYVPFRRQRGQERLDLTRAHILGVAFAVVEDVTFDPLGVGFFGTAAVVFGADSRPHLLQQPWFLDNAVFVDRKRRHNNLLVK